MVFRNVIKCLMLAALTVGICNSAHATGELKDKLSQVAADIVKSTHHQAVIVGHFTPSGLADHHGGPSLENLLTNELEHIKKGIVTTDPSHAKFEIKGDFVFAKDRVHPERRAIKITVRLIDIEFGEEIKELRIKTTLEGNSTIAKVLQVTASIDPHGQRTPRNKEIQKRVLDPSVHIAGTKCAAGPGSEYSVEVLVKPVHSHSPAVARAITQKHGAAFVDIHKDELYEVKVHNNSSREVAIALNIDGLDMFHFSKNRNPKTGRPAFTHLILQPHKSTTIVGWHNEIDPHSKANYLSFLVTGYGQGAVSKAGIKARGKVGVIHVSFAHCVPLAHGQKSRSGNETGFGPPRKITQKAVRYEIEPPHEFLAIRYTRPQH